MPVRPEMIQLIQAQASSRSLMGLHVPRARPMRTRPSSVSAEAASCLKPLATPGPQLGPAWAKVSEAASEKA